MLTKKLVAAAVFALAPFAAQAALTTMSPPDWPPVPSTGLETVQFNRVNIGANGAFVAMGAHGYKNGPTLPNDGVSVFFAQSGIYPGEPTKNYANWSFDFSFNTAGCTACNVFLEVDTDPTDGVTYNELLNLSAIYGGRGSDSWNMEMIFINPLLEGYNFDPFSASSTAFRISMVEGSSLNDPLLGAAAITVNVPEPGSVALTGLAFAGLALARRRKAAKKA